MTADPLGLHDGPNLYAYLQNSPLNDLDPWGLCGSGGSYWTQAFAQAFAGIAAAEAFHVGELMFQGAIISFSAGPAGIPAGFILTAGGAVSIGTGAYLTSYALTGHF